MGYSSPCVLRRRDPRQPRASWTSEPKWLSLINAVGFFPYSSVGTEQALCLTSERQERSSQPTNSLPFALQWANVQVLAFHAASPERSQGLGVWLITWLISGGSSEDGDHHGEPHLVFSPLFAPSRCLGLHLLRKHEFSCLSSGWCLGHPH